MLSPRPEPELARSLSLLRAVLVGLGVIIGAGIDLPPRGTCVLMLEAAPMVCCGKCRHHSLRRLPPPSTKRPMPVMKLASSEARKRAA
jgi:hypothetical protein